MATQEQTAEGTTADPKANGKATKPKPEVTTIKMNDGRDGKFVGKRNLNKDYVVDTEKGTVTASFDFRNGEALSFSTGIDDIEMLLNCAGHGIVQKGGDECSKVKALANGEPDVDSMAVAVGNVLDRMRNTAAAFDDRWYAAPGEGDSFSGAAVVIKAVAMARLDLLKANGKRAATDEVTNEDITWVKAHLEKKLEDGKAAGLTRQKLYQAYRKPGSKTAIIIAQLEQEKLAAATKDVNVDADLEAMAEA